MLRQRQRSPPGFSVQSRVLSLHRKAVARVSSPIPGRSRHAPKTACLPRTPPVHLFLVLIVHSLLSLFLGEMLSSRTTTIHFGPVQRHSRCRTFRAARRKQTCYLHPSHFPTPSVSPPPTNLRISTQRMTRPRLNANKIRRLDRRHKQIIQ